RSPPGGRRRRPRRGPAGRSRDARARRGTRAACRGSRWPPPPAGASRSRGLPPEPRPHHVEHALDALDAGREQLDVALGRDGLALAGALHLDYVALTSGHYVEVERRGDVLGVVEV